MADIELEKEHNFDFETARAKAKKLLASIEEKGINVDYVEGENEDVANIKQSGVTARATLDENKLRFEADLAFLAKPLKGKIIEMVQRGMDKHLG